MKCPYCQSQDIIESENGPIRLTVCNECKARGIQIKPIPMEWVSGKGEYTMLTLQKCPKCGYNRLDTVAGACERRQCGFVIPPKEDGEEGPRPAAGD